MDGVVAWSTPRAAMSSRRRVTLSPNRSSRWTDSLRWGLDSADFLLQSHHLGKDRALAKPKKLVPGGGIEPPRSVKSFGF